MRVENATRKQQSVQDQSMTMEKSLVMMKDRNDHEE